MHKNGQRVACLLLQRSARSQSATMLWGLIQWWLRSARVGRLGQQLCATLSHFPSKPAAVDWNLDSTFQVELTGCKACFNTEDFVNTLALAIQLEPWMIAVQCVLSGSVIVQLKIVRACHSTSPNRSPQQAVERLLKLAPNQLPGYQVTSVSVVPPCYAEATLKLVLFMERRARHALCWGAMSTWRCVTSSASRERSLILEHQQQETSTQHTLSALTSHIETLEGQQRGSPQCGDSKYSENLPPRAPSTVGWSKLAEEPENPDQQPTAAPFDSSMVFEESEHLGSLLAEGGDDDGFLSFLEATAVTPKHSTPGGYSSNRVTALARPLLAHYTTVLSLNECARALRVWHIAAATSSSSSSQPSFDPQLTRFLSPDSRTNKVKNTSARSVEQLQAELASLHSQQWTKIRLAFS